MHSSFNKLNIATFLGKCFFPSLLLCFFLLFIGQNPIFFLSIPWATILHYITSKKIHQVSWNHQQNLPTPIRTIARHCLTCNHNSKHVNCILWFHSRLQGIANHCVSFESDKGIEGIPDYVRIPRVKPFSKLISVNKCPNI